MTSVLVTGSRDWPSNAIIAAVLSDFIGGKEPTTLINGGAVGVDSLAARFWRDNNIGNVITVYPDWKLHGRKAGIVRNIDMLNMDPDYVIAFIYNGSAGASFTYQKALERGMNVRAVRLDSHKGVKR